MADSSLSGTRLRRAYIKMNIVMKVIAAEKPIITLLFSIIYHPDSENARKQLFINFILLSISRFLATKLLTFREIIGVLFQFYGTIYINIILSRTGIF
jgi:hypothetical protein